MGQRCCKPSVFGDLPTRIRILVEGSDDSETLNLIPDSYESLVQSVYPFAVSHLSVTSNDYLVLMHMRTPTSGVRISRLKEFKHALKRCKGKEMLVKITKGNYEAALDLPLHPVDDSSTNSFIQKFSQTLTTFKVSFLDFSQCLNQLLQLASSMSQFTLHPSVESAATAVLLTLVSENGYSDEAIGLKITSKHPFITVNIKNLKPVSIGVMRLWNDFVQTLPKLAPLIATLREDFPILMRTMTEYMMPAKKKAITSPELVLKTKQCFDDASAKCEATENQLVTMFSRFESDHNLARLHLLRRINTHSLTSGLSSVLALYDLKGNAK